MRGGVVLFIAALAGCANANDDYAKSVAENAQRRAMDAQAEIDQLKIKIKDLEDDRDSLRKGLLVTMDSLAALRKTFNSNVDIDNSRNDALRTRLGDCGKEWVQGDQGWVTVNRDCSKVKPKPKPEE